MDTFREKIVKGTFWSASQSWGTQIFSFLVFVVMSRLLAPQAFGLIALASVFLAFVQTFLDQGIASALIQRVDVDREHFDTAFWMNVILGGLMTLLGIACAKYIAVFFREPQLEMVIRWLSFVFLLAGLSSTQQAILQREMAFRKLALRSLFSNLLGGATGIMLAFFGFGVWSLVAQNLVIGLTGVILLWRVSDWRPRLLFSRRHFWEMQKFGVNIIGTNILNFFNRRADDLLIGFFLGATALGYYTIAYRILLVMTDVLTGFANSVAFPVFSRLQAEPARILQAFYRATEYMSYISFPAFVGVCVLAPEIIQVLFGLQWWASIPVLQILMFIGILHSLLYFHSTLMISVGKSSWRLWLTLLNAVTNVLAFLLVVRWGIVAVAAAYVLRAYLFLPLEVWTITYLVQLDLKKYFAQYFVPLVATIVMFFFVLGIRYFLTGSNPSLWLLLIYVVIGIISYIGVVAILKPIIIRQGVDLLSLILPVREK